MYTFTLLVVKSHQCSVLRTCFMELASALSWGLRAVDDAVSCTTPTVTPSQCTKFIFALTFFLH